MLEVDNLFFPSLWATVHVKDLLSGRASRGVGGLQLYSPKADSICDQEHIEVDRDHPNYDQLMCYLLAVRK